MSVNPITASKEITETFLRYIKTTFFIDDKVYMEKFKKQLQADSFFYKGPYLDFTDSFELGDSIKELIDKNVLNEDFLKVYINNKQILERKLYKHQELSIKRLKQNNNLIVTTGTGSGKTESFLIPILNYLMDQKKRGELNPGVRAIIIYPMNALANDQMKRMRELLSSYTDITFGAYTGETEETEKDAIKKFRSINQHEPKSNEIISRQEMKERPPHILITNYAMLEYLMLRPKDNVFFSGNYAENWKYVVLDEAHTYKGATGIEVALLIRRLVNILRNKENVNFILTSATLGDEKSDKQIIDFASRLCADYKFTESDIIRAFRHNYCKSDKLHSYDVSIYSKLKELCESTEDINLYYSLFDEYNIHYDKNQKNIEALIFDFIKVDIIYFNLRNFIKISPRTINEISSYLKLKSSLVVDFVFLANKANKNGVALLDSRYHMFIRSLEGAYITLGEKKALSLQPTNSIMIDKEEYPAFSINVCRYCGKIYLVGQIKGNKFTQIKESKMENKNSYFMVLNKNEIMNDDEDLKGDEEFIEYVLCGKCGTIERKNILNSKMCSCGEQYIVNIVEIKNQKKGLHKCLSCGVQNTRQTILRGFYLGQEAAASVVASSLYSVLPSDKKRIRKIVNPKKNNSFFGIEISEPDKVEIVEKIKTNKQLLIFSDSRQQAAYFASYLNFTYNNILKRRIFVEALRNLSKSLSSEYFEISNVVSELSNLFNIYHICNNLHDSKKLAWKTLLYEISTYDRNGLESLGIVSFEMKERKVPYFGRFQGKDAITLQRVLANSFKKGCIFNHNYYERMNSEDKESYLFNGIQTLMNLQKDSRNTGYTKNKRNWIPSSKSNSRYDYLMKILKDDDGIKDYLSHFWNDILISSNYLTFKDDAYLMNIDKFKVRTSICHDINWYKCDKCGKLTVNNINNKCPVYRCNGTLFEVDVEKEFKDNHYRKMYLNMNIESMIVKEHTAQLSPNTAKEYQEQFLKKNINVLSSSTTFEMGVDVGSLETVFMKNMPPAPSNYIQRAGRAGRRSSSVAYALTYCNLASHDLTFFRNPIQMIRGQINPPKFKVENEKIIKRHINAALISSFWKVHPELYKNTKTFFENDNFDLLINYINNLPESVLSYIKAFSPSSYEDNIPDWINHFGSLKGLLVKEYNLYTDEIQNLLEYRKDINIELNANVNKGKGFVIDKIDRYIFRINSENILSFLSRKNIIPKYGFPIDTVELKSNFSALDRLKSNSRLRLQRDLKIAISEYAPGSEVIADGKIYTSRYIKKPSSNKLIWKLYDYSLCSNPQCNHMNLRPHIFDPKKDSTCQICGDKIYYKDTFIIPEYGFVIDEDVKDATNKKPDRTYNGDIYYLGNAQELKEESKREYQVKNKLITIKSTTDDELVVVNNTNFYVCESCGYSIKDDTKFENYLVTKKSHRTPYGKECNNLKLNRRSLGHIFKTDVSYISFNRAIDKDIALSVLYSLLEGISAYLRIERNDISGTIYYVKTDNNEWHTDFILFDNVPGGAGHVRRIGRSSKEEFIDMLKSSFNVVNNCSCGKENGGDSSCYSCLCNYYNQKYHDVLKRKYAIDFLKDYIEEENG